MKVSRPIGQILHPHRGWLPSPKPNYLLTWDASRKLIKQSSENHPSGWPIFRGGAVSSMLQVMASPQHRPVRTAQPAELRPAVTEAFHTTDLPATPQRDRTLPANLWIEAPDALVMLGRDLGHELVTYKRRIGRWLLWRAGPAVNDHARYMAIDVDDLDRRFTFTLDPEGTGSGIGPDGIDHTRFRSWKEALRDSDAAGKR